MTNLLRCLMILTAFFSGVVQANHLVKCEVAGEICVEQGEERIVDNARVYQECWRYEKTYSCFEEENTTCPNLNLNVWDLDKTTDEVFFQGEPANPAIEWKEHYISNERWDTVCDTAAANQFCSGNLDCDLSPPQFQCELLDEPCVDIGGGPRDPGNNGSIIERTCWQKEANWSCYDGTASTTCSGPTSGCDWTGFDCNRTSDTVLENPVYGQCVERVDNFICTSGQITSCTGSTAGCSNILQGVVTSTAPNGAITGLETVLACPVGNDYGQYCNTDPVCDLIDTECIAWATSAQTVCIEEEQSYRCERVTTTCPSGNWITPPNCNGVTAHGMDSVFEPVGNNFDAALKGAGMIDAITDGAEVVGGGELVVFEGEYQDCKYITTAAMNVLNLAIASGGAGILGPTEGIMGSLLGISFLNGMDLDCCSSDPANISDVDIGLGYCEEEDRELAAARSNNRTTSPRPSIVDIGPVCLGVDDPILGCLGFDIDIQRRQYYCVFDSVLARVIQEQGRAQLAEMDGAMQGAAQSQTVSFPYYRAEPTHGWAPEVTVNGNRITYFQWSENCKDSITATRGAQDGSILCPANPEIFFATCFEAPGAMGAQTCDTLPADPRNGNSNWMIDSVNPAKPGAAAISEYTGVQGACDQVTSCRVGPMPEPPSGPLPGQLPGPQFQTYSNTCVSLTNLTNGQLCRDSFDPDSPGDFSCTDILQYQNCSYELNSFPAGVGGLIHASFPFNWPLFYPANYTDAAQTGNDLNWFPSTTFAGQYEFQGYSYDLMNPPASTPIRIRYRQVNDNGGSAGPWNDLIIPNQIPMDPEYIVSTNADPTDISLYGGCTQNCEYIINTELVATAKPWIDASGDVDCSGFSIQELQLLDFDKMDMSDFVGDIGVEADAAVVPSTASVVSMVAGGAPAFNNAFQNNEVLGSNHGERIAKIHPDDGYITDDIPLVSTLQVAAIYKVTRNGVMSSLAVTNVEVDWGDGNNGPIFVNGTRFRQTHTYDSLPADPTEFNVVVTIFLENGDTKTENLQVIGWQNSSTSSFTSAGGTVGDDSGYVPNRVPGGGRATDAPSMYGSSPTF